MADEQIKVVYSVDTAEVLTAERATESLRKSTERMADSVDRAERSSRNLGRATLEGGRVLQDFAQGGIGGILNNIEGLTVALGGGPGMAGLLTGVGLAAYFAIPAIKAFASSVVDGSNDVPEAANRLDRLGDALKTVDQRLKELKEKGWLTDRELDEYNDKLERRAQLEDRIATAKTAQAAAEGPTKEEKAAAPDEKIRADFLRESTEWGSDEIKAVRDAVASGTRDRIRSRLDQIDEALAEAAIPEFTAKRGKDGQWFNVRNPLYRARRERDRALQAERARLEAEAASADDAADSVVAGVTAGDPEAIRRAMSATPDAAIRGTLNRALSRPESLRRAKEEADREREAREVEKLEEKRRLAMEAQSGRFEEQKAQAEAKAQADERAREARNVGHWERITRSDEAREQAKARRAEVERIERAERLRSGQEGRERAQLQQFAARQGVDIPSDQLGPVLNDMRQFMASGASPMEAAAAAMQQFLMANQATIQRMRSLESQFAAFAANAHQQMMATQQTMPTLTPRGR